MHDELLSQGRVKIGYNTRMDTNSVNALNERLSTDIPLINAMSLRVLSASPESVEVDIPFEGNGNDKGTLFAGAAYSAMVLAGWTLAMERAKASGFDNPWAAIVDAHIHYAKPVRENATATAVFAEEPNLVPGARNWAKVKVSIGEVVAFEGTYAVGIFSARSRD